MSSKTAAKVAQAVNRVVPVHKVCYQPALMLLSAASDAPPPSLQVLIKDTEIHSPIDWALGNHPPRLRRRLYALQRRSLEPPIP